MCFVSQGRAACAAFHKGLLTLTETPPDPASASGVVRDVEGRGVGFGRRNRGRERTIGVAGLDDQDTLGASIGDVEADVCLGVFHILIMPFLYETWIRGGRGGLAWRTCEHACCTRA